MKSLIMGFVVLGLSACSAVTIQPHAIAKITSKATYEDSRPFYLWGLVGEERVDVKEICTDTQAAQMQSQQTFSDGALGLITLGIYSPHTIKVWCEEQNTQEAL
ncbi:Bor family protein [Pseudoalteromonas sp. 13-15]|jgi:hypothetical protein|uniref:Bor family protein n=1 Tax=Pseudoalteromonas marina TaxID=267375 RepID=A0ABT9FFZ3_9GAMM|nr:MULTISPECIES: Bor family protein [Pseudoalteromonas]AUL74364.1 Bor family protein [Pseudoalteromonas sp. 13-15]MDA8939439.1 Bor family protein [Pseudoalteromonas marina]MDP2486512.1 Bor family protein [Pseudoalteromonas marina]MDP2565401.1 Bor family protein [Pseudoalteromonas marina]WFO19298.1 Bor family protein [Pseudoalteromonas sp. H100]